MPEDYRDALAAGFIAADLVLPGGLLGTQRVVRISRERIRHIAERRPDWLIFCLTNMARVLHRPEYLGYRWEKHPCCVELASRVGPERQLLTVVVKFIDLNNEAWIVTMYPLSKGDLTRRLRANTMKRVDGES